LIPPLSHMLERFILAELESPFHRNLLLRCNPPDRWNAKGKNLKTRIQKLYNQTFTFSSNQCIHQVI
jgi:hypothetical protein